MNSQGDIQTTGERLLDEEELVGALLQHPEMRDRVRPRVTRRHFLDESLGEAFAGCYRILDLTTQSLAEHLRKHHVSHPPGGAGWIDFLEVLADRTLGLSAAGILAHADAIRKRGLDRRRRGLLIEAGTAGANGDDLSATLAKLERGIAEIRQDEPQRATLLSASRNYAEVLADETSPAKDLIEGHILTTRVIGEFHGDNGARKSWEMLQLLLYAAVGRDCWGLPMRAGGIRCGYLSLEDEIDLVKERLQIIAIGMNCTEEEEQLATENLHVLASPYVKDDPPFDITQEWSQEMLMTWIQVKRVDLVAIDHLSAAAPSLPNEFDLRPVFLPARTIARATDSAILFSHHDRKVVQGMNARDRGGSRGDSRFPAACRFRVHSEKIGEEDPESGTLIRLTFEKTTRGATPKPIWLRHLKDCPLVVVEPPKRSQEAKAVRMEEVLKAIHVTGRDKGISPAEIGEMFLDASRRPTVSDRTIRGYAAALEARGKIRREGRAQKTRYYPVAEVRQSDTPSEPSSGQCTT